MATGQRFWRLMRAWLAGADGAGAAPAEDPEDLLARAQQEMRDLHAKNRERAVQAITQKNNLQQIVDDTQKRVDLLQQKAELALERGDEALAARLDQERMAYEGALFTTRQSLEQAEAVAEQVKQAIRREEEKLRQKTAHALALKVQWKALQLHREIVRGAQYPPGEGGGMAAPSPEKARALLEQAKAQRDELAAVTEGTSRQVTSLRDKVGLARSRGDEETERALLREMEQYEATLAQMREALAQAVEVTARAERYLSGEADEDEVADWQAFAADAALPPAPSGAASIADVERFDGLAYAAMLGLAVLLAVLALLLLWWLLR